MMKRTAAAVCGAAVLAAGMTGCGAGFEGSGSKDAASAEQLAMRLDDPWAQEVQADQGAKAEGELADGVYTGTGKGMEGLVTVKLLVQDNRISCLETAQEHCRKLITPDLEQIDKVPEHYRDWHHGVQDAIDADVLKKRDSLEELERDLGFAPGVLVEAVEKWNACCERGEDDFMYPMPPEWLHAIKDPPFYGCRIGGNLYGTKAGLMINDEMQVISTKGTVIPGLYAGWHTAGGACGENSYIGDPILGSLLGDVSLAFCGGYLCGTYAVANEMKGGE